MKPIEFTNQNIVFAKDQPEYQPLPAYTDERETISKWEFTPQERKEIARGANLWLRQCNFGQALQPQLPTLGHPFLDFPDELPEIKFDVHHTTITHFTFWDRVKILFGKQLKIESTITVDAVCDVLGSSAKTTVPPFIKPKIGGVGMVAPTHHKEN